MDRSKLTILALVIMMATLHKVRCITPDDVDGDLGEGRTWDSMMERYARRLPDPAYVQSKDECCDACAGMSHNNAFGEAKMYTYLKSAGFCYCYDTRGTRRPRTEGAGPGDYAGLCDVTVCYEDGINTQGRQQMGRATKLPDWTYCGDSCRNKRGCTYWTYVKDGNSPYAKNCAHMSGFTRKVNDPNTISGPKSCAN